VNIKETEGFTMSRDTISIHFVNAALLGVKRLGMDVDTLLSHVGIEAELLRQPKARISPEQYTRFVKMLWMVTQDEHVGFDIQPRRLGSFAIMCQLIIHAKTLDNLKVVYNRMLEGTDTMEPADISFRADLDKIDWLESFNENKRLLIKLLDKNGLYYNYSEIDDINVRELISDNDYLFNKQFYKGGE